SFDHTLSEPLRWSEDGASLSFTAADQGATHLYRITAVGGTPELVVGGEREVTDVAVAGGRTVFIATSPMQPAELFVLVDGRERQLTDLNAAWKAEVELSTPESIWFTSADGTPVQGWVMKPVGYRE